MIEKSKIKSKNYSLFEIRNSNSGTTLIELILYIAIVSTMLVTLIQMAWNVIGSSAKSAIQQDVSANARYISERILYEIRNSNGTPIVTATSVTLPNTTGTLNPTIITCSANNITIKQGTDPVIQLNSSTISVPTANCSFTNYTGTNTRNVGFDITVTDNNATARTEYAASTRVKSAAEIRSN